MHVLVTHSCRARVRGKTPRHLLTYAHVFSWSAQLDMRKRIKGNLPQHVDDTEEDNFGGRLLEIQRRKREEDEARKAHAARS